ncbi:MAG TPA: hypothetical protein DCY89_07715 [Gammaproteobacteria bacterium]|nr:hypothetical protein [Gammaproteobacteria bacterium]
MRRGLRGQVDGCGLGKGTMIRLQGVGTGMWAVRLPALLLVLAGVALLLWQGDARGWFGSRPATVDDVLQVTFRPVDAATGRRLADVRVNCFMRGREQACSQVRDGRSMLLTIAVAVRRSEQRGLFTRHASRIIGADDRPIHLMFIAPDYNRLVHSYRLGELAALATAGEQRVELTRSTAPDGPGSGHADAEGSGDAAGNADVGGGSHAGETIDE